MFCEYPLTEDVLNELDSLPAKLAREKLGNILGTESSLAPPEPCARAMFDPIERDGARYPADSVYDFAFRYSVTAANNPAIIVPPANQTGAIA